MTDLDAPAAVPPLVPARMVNEFTYCPRLFFLEWVQARFEDNADTVGGRAVHRRVDRSSGRPPPPGLVPEDGFPPVRSVQLSSVELGLVGKVDLLEAGAGQAVVPVDYKRGRPPDNPERSWEPERVQLCVQGLLLREAGYACARGELWFAETRERVSVDFDEALVDRTLGLVDELRRVASEEEAPPPLVHSRKCPRCSLVGICLPDEVNALADRDDQPPRRLLPRDRDQRPLYITEQGAYVGRAQGRVEVSIKGEKRASVRIIDVSQLCLFGNVQASTQLMRELFAREVPICYFSYGGWFTGMAHGLPSKHVELRRRQVLRGAADGLSIARAMVVGKIRNARTMLMRNARRRPGAAIASLKELASSAAVASSSATLLGVEGAAARAYFGCLPEMLRVDKRLPGEGFAFEGRNRRPPLDAVNCLLSFVYGLLVKDLTTTVLAVGFDPYVGFYHRPRFGRPALALDLAEELRPIVGDSVVINVINNGEVSASDFIVRGGGVALTENGRKAVIRAYERRLDAEVKHPLFGYRISYRRVLDVQARLLAAHLLSEVPEYVAFTTR